MEIEIVFGLPIVLYFFFAGTAAGLFIISAVTNLLEKEKYIRLSLTGLILSFLSLSAGALLLLSDLGKPLRFWRLFYLPGLNPVSAITWGNIFISLFFIIVLAEIAFFFFKKKIPALLHYAGILISFGLGSYTGFLIGVCKGYPLWHSAIMAPLFFVSGCISGTGLILLVSVLSGLLTPQDKATVVLRRTLLFLLLIDLFLLTDYYILYMGYSEAKEVALLILTGRFATLFWLGEVLIGVAVPILLLFSGMKNTRPGLALAGLTSVIGVIIMRYIIVIGGQVLPHWKPFS